MISLFKFSRKLNFIFRNKQIKFSNYLAFSALKNNDGGRPTTPISPEKPLFDSSLKSGIYVITCLPLEKHYVGMSQHTTRRINAHKSKLNRNCHECKDLQQDFNTYGINNFVFKKLIFGTGLPKNELEEMETLILVTLPREKRYNLYTNWRKRGSETNPFFKKSHTAEARQAQSLANKGKPSGFSGKTQSEDVKRRVSEINSGTSSRDRKPLSIDNVFYESVTAAAEETGLARRLVRERCNSKEERFKNYKWVGNENTKKETE
jgi:group I intron endonuclease